MITKAVLPAEERWARGGAGTRWPDVAYRPPRTDPAWISSAPCSPVLAVVNRKRAGPRGDKAALPRAW
ncbi:hypothetical protein Ait01nite_034220 [Actinoplanes italicus]|nr:hypothetical protein Ait01nite_034220 [Actinoplanes italicus]